VPHVTVLRDAIAPVSARLPEPVAWPVGGFALVGSSLDPPQPYRTLGAWALR
jgi:2'-5' RNA ligase